LRGEVASGSPKGVHGRYSGRMEPMAHGELG
jgi:hypothetical protein